MSSAMPTRAPSHEGFLHEAMLYAGEDDFAGQTIPFLQEGIRNHEPTLVVVSERKIDRLRKALGDEHAKRVYFADMADVGANPACIIPAWTDFVTQHASAGRRLRGVGEPIWKGRSQAELRECQHHEALLNVAFAEAPDFWLICPYDTTSLDASVLAEANRSHPAVRHGTTSHPSPTYAGLDAASAPFDAPLLQPTQVSARHQFVGGSLGTVRAVVMHQAARAGLGVGRVADVVQAVSEVATNSLKFGGGHGTLRVWRDDHALVCEVADSGHLSQPLAGRQRPDPNAEGGRGLWLVNHLCDLVELRSYPSGVVVRLHMHLT
jgi:anti-sigma regulatory factor (Ser/Thr protein kinase)